MHVTQSTVSRVLSAFVNSIASKASQYINMPRKETEISRAVSDFQQILGMPMVVGAIDESHNPMIAPSNDEYAYVNRKQYHSINMQAICDSNLIFQDVVARWPESHQCNPLLSMTNLKMTWETVDDLIMFSILYIIPFV